MRYIMWGISILCIALLSSCSHNGKVNSGMSGRWICGIEDTDIKGFEYIDIKADGGLLLEDSISYSQEEDFLRVAVRAVVINSGTWKEEDGNLTFNLKEAQVTIDTTSLSIHSSKPEIEIDSTSNEFQALKKDLLREMKSNLLEKFDARSGKEVSMGRVEIVKNNEMRLTNNDIYVSMIRVR